MYDVESAQQEGQVVPRPAPFNADSTHDEPAGENGQAETADQIMLEPQLAESTPSDEAMAAVEESSRLGFVEIPRDVFQHEKPRLRNADGNRQQNENYPVDDDRRHGGDGSDDRHDSKRDDHDDHDRHHPKPDDNDDHRRPKPDDHDDHHRPKPDDNDDHHRPKPDDDEDDYHRRPDDHDDHRHRRPDDNDDHRRPKPDDHDDGHHRPKPDDHDDGHHRPKPDDHDDHHHRKPDDHDDGHHRPKPDDHDDGHHRPKPDDHDDHHHRKPDDHDDHHHRKPDDHDDHHRRKPDDHDDHHRRKPDDHDDHRHRRPDDHDDHHRRRPDDHDDHHHRTPDDHDDHHHRKPDDHDDHHHRKPDDHDDHHHRKPDDHDDHHHRRPDDHDDHHHRRWPDDHDDHHHRRWPDDDRHDGRGHLPPCRHYYHHRPHHEYDHDHHRHHHGRGHHLSDEDDMMSTPDGPRQWAGMLGANHGPINSWSNPKGLIGSHLPRADQSVIAAVVSLVFLLLVSAALYVAAKTITRPYSGQAHSFVATGKTKSRQSRKGYTAPPHYMLNKDNLYLFTQSWLPVNKQDARAVVILAHGVGEHSGRYTKLARKLCDEARVAVVALDHQGHGRSEGDRLFVVNFEDYVDDIAALAKQTAECFPGKPLIILGHSMGGLIAIRTVEKYPGLFSSAIFSAPALSVVASASERRLAPLLSQKLPHLPMKKIDPNALSHDPAVVDLYCNDPLCVSSQGVTARLGCEFLDAIDRAQAFANEITLPYLILRGGDDRITLKPGVDQFYQATPSTDKSYIELAGLYHEIFNEPDSVAAKHVIDWLNQRQTPVSI